MYIIFMPPYLFHYCEFSENNCFLQVRKTQNILISGKDSLVIALKTLEDLLFISHYKVQL